MTKSLQRQQQVYNIFKKENPAAIAREIGEGAEKRGLTFIRWCGSGDLFPEACAVINHLAALYPELKQWITTRKPDMVALLSNSPSLYIGFSLDASEESLVRKKQVESINHPRLYFSYLRTGVDEDTMGTAIIFNQQRNKSLTNDDKRKCCPVDAGKLKTEAACGKCRKCFSEKVYENTLRRESNER